MRHILASGVEEVTVYTLTTTNPGGGVRMPSRVDGVCSACGTTTDSQAFTYDAVGHLLSRTDGAGHTTTYAYDALGNVTSVTEAAGTPRARTTTYEYLDPLWPTFLSRITQASVAGASAGRVTTHAWNADHTVLTTTVSGNLAPGQPATYTTVMTYDSRHRLLTVDGPRTDVTDVSSRLLYADTDADPNRRGRLLRTTNALGQTTTFDDYDLYGTPRSVVDANGVSSVVVTDFRGRVTSTTSKAVAADPSEATDYTTAVAYDDRDRLVETTSARGMTTRHVHQNATNWLTDTVRLDAAGNEVERRHLTLNAAGMKVADADQSCPSPAPSCSSWVTKRSESFVYDAKGRLVEVQHAVPADPKVVYEYDADGKLLSVQDENHPAPNTTYAYDELDRLITVTQKLGAGSVVTRYDYDAQDNLVSVTDPNGNVTTYAYDDFGRMQRQSSPVTGETTYAYDAAGNLLSTHDANGATTTRTYDALSRVTSATSSRAGAATESVSWTYDAATAGNYAVGRVTSMSDPTGSTLYRYDRRGLLKSEEKTIDGTSFTTSFAHDPSGNRVSLTYPSGRVVTYGYDFADRPVSAAAGATPLVTSATYLPFGPMTSLTYGNGTTKTMTYDARYRPTENKLTGPSGTIADYLYATDAAGNITRIHDALSPPYDRDFGYDDLNRLTSAATGSSLWGSGAYSYDAMGNLLSLTLGTSRSATFAYAGTTPKLTSVTEDGSARAITYDAAGNEAACGRDDLSLFQSQSPRRGRGGDVSLRWPRRPHHHQRCEARSRDRSEPGDRQQPLDRHRDPDRARPGRRRHRDARQRRSHARDRAGQHHHRRRPDHRHLHRDRLRRPRHSLGADHGHLERRHGDRHAHSHARRMGRRLPHPRSDGRARDANDSREAGRTDDGHPHAERCRAAPGLGGRDQLSGRGVSRLVDRRNERYIRHVHGRRHGAGAGSLPELPECGLSEVLSGQRDVRHDAQRNVHRAYAGRRVVGDRLGRPRRVGRRFPGHAGSGAPAPEGWPPRDGDHRAGRRCAGGRRLDRDALRQSGGVRATPARVHPSRGAVDHVRRRNGRSRSRDHRPHHGHRERHQP
ncbi:MAG TPA: hypothetical protein VJ276_06830 [Thermoanaerobaculia bacterium]|nr:hypothetical protein [Thermoanaerobaculia bacterium]